jgi:hypothetical protein
MPYSRISLAILCTLMALAPLARGSVHMWAVTLMQTGVMICMGLLLLESLHLKRPLIPNTLLTRPLLVILVLSGISAVRSAYPGLALEGFLLLSTYVAVYFITQSVVRTRQEQRIIVFTIIGTALFLAVFGLFKRFGLNPFPFWQYDDGPNNPNFLTSTFVNYSHLAGFLELSLPFLLSLFLTRSRQTSILFVLIYLVLILLTAQALSMSRGGWTATTISLCFMGMVLLSQRRCGSKKLILGLGAAFILSVIILVSTPVVKRIMTLTDQAPAATWTSSPIIF